jgi:integrase
MHTQRWLNFLVLSDHELDRPHLYGVLMALSEELGADRAREIVGRLCLELVSALMDSTHNCKRFPLHGDRDSNDTGFRSLRPVAVTEQSSNAMKSGRTVRSVMKAWMANTYSENSKQGHRVHGFLQRLVFPQIGHIALGVFTPSDMQNVLDHIAVSQNKRATSRLCRMWMRAALRYAKTQRLISTETLWEFMEIDPVRHKTRHKVPLTACQIRELWNDLDRLSSVRTVIGIRLLLLTFVRPVELMCAPWTEFDLDGTQSEYGPTWTIPPQRVKMRTAHIVPLSRQAVQLLQELRKVSGQHSLLFPGSTQNKPVTRQSWRDALCTIGWEKRFTLHACRATASTLMREFEMGTNDCIEIQLGHLTRSETRASYDFACYVRQRHTMMQSWSDYVYRAVGYTDPPEN